MVKHIPPFWVEQMRSTPAGLGMDVVLAIHGFYPWLLKLRYFVAWVWHLRDFNPQGPTMVSYMMPFFDLWEAQSKSSTTGY